MIYARSILSICSHQMTYKLGAKGYYDVGLYQ